ncbi:MAG TPA: CCA tRNA nucleotidyltransferase [Candidatus Cloacimonetes bacterium]|nr:CCA tRNA nucleotidyltransferase [Candidatus Cloacimonadota bacterium]
MKIPRAYIKRIPHFFSPALETIPDLVMDVARDVQQAGGKAFLVGGSVRDMLLGNRPTKDIDVEVYGLRSDQLETIVLDYGKVAEVGKSFGVLKFFDGKIEIDFSLPRKDSKVGEGHRGFAIDTDPDMDIKEAARRRDFTINAMMYDPVEELLIDCFGGLDDLEKGVLRVVDKKTFAEDPLRVMRGVQFIARFDLMVDIKSFNVMQKTVPSLGELPKERLQMEWMKLLLKAMKPSLGLETMLDLGIIERYYPELFLLTETEQDHLWHPEGNVWIHTLLCLNAGAQIIHRERMRVKQAFVIMLAILCHDLGKPKTTHVKDSRIVTPEHEAEGEKPTRTFLSRIGADGETTKKVVNLVKNHLVPFSLYKAEFHNNEKITDGAIRRLARRLHPATIYELSLVAEADYLGKGARLKEKDRNFKSGKWLIERSQKLKVDKNKPENVIDGKDLIELGFEPGRLFGAIIELANELRDNLNFSREKIISLINKSETLGDALLRLKQELEEE